MARARRLRSETTNAQAFFPSRNANEQLADRRLGGMVLVDYLFNLFAASPFEQFSRLNVLTLLDQVKKDASLFPDAGQTVNPSASHAKPVRSRVSRRIRRTVYADIPPSSCHA